MDTGKGFVQFNRDYDHSIHKYPFAFNLLAVIAQRAKRTEHFDNKDLELGEALLGDYKNQGLTRQQYRTALTFLKSTNIITYRTTTKGTIAKIVNSTIFDINQNEATNQVTNTITTEQPATNQRATTNNNENNEKNEKQTGADMLRKVSSKEIDSIALSINLAEDLVRFVVEKELIPQYDKNGRSIKSTSGLILAACKSYQSKNPGHRNYGITREKKEELDRKPWYFDTLDPRYFTDEAEIARNQSFVTYLGGKGA